MFSQVVDELVGGTKAVPCAIEPDNEDNLKEDLEDEEVDMMFGITESFKSKVKAKVSRQEISKLEETKLPSLNRTQSTPVASMAQHSFVSNSTPS